MPAETRAIQVALAMHRRCAREERTTFRPSSPSPSNLQVTMSPAGFELIPEAKTEFE
jgi:hypothetical protein